MRVSSGWEACCLTLALLFLCNGATAFGQPIDPKTFYDKDYAVSPNYRPGSKEPTSPSSTNPTTSNQAARIPGANALPSTGLQQTPANNPLEAISSDTWVEVVVNSLDEKHFMDVIAEVLNVARSQRANILSVSHIGDYRVMSDEIKKQLAEFDITVVDALIPPHKLTLLQSPTWIFNTAQGRYVVEGAPSIEQCLSPTGEFQRPHAVAPTKKPEQRISGF